MNDAVQLSDIDGTVKGLAAVMSIDLENPGGHNGFMNTVFEENESSPNPIASVHAFWRSLKADWPKHTAAYASNHRAKYLMNKQRMEAMTGTPYTHADYIEQCNREAAQ